MATTRDLTQFRTRLYRILPGRGDVLLDLLDALSGNQGAKSAVQLSQSPAFRRTWSSVSASISRFFHATSAETAMGERARLERRFVREAQSLQDVLDRRNHWLFALDGTPLVRQHAPCVSDRSWVHKSDAAPNGAPVTIGHLYSLLVALPEMTDPADPAWVLPLSSRRVPSTQTANEVGWRQVHALLDDPQLPWNEELTVVMGDSAYSCLPFLGPLDGFESLVLLARVRSNRVFYAPPEPGGRKQYGAPFRLRIPKTWTEPVETCSFVQETSGGKRIEYRIQRFADLRLRGSRQHPMHRRPFDLLRVTRYDEHGRWIVGSPLWLMLMGPRRGEIVSVQAVQDYQQRFDQEHFHRFCKQNLLLEGFQTPITEHEENWVTLVTMAYSLLYSMRYEAQLQYRPWESQPVRAPGRPLSPTMVQRDYLRLIQELGTPARYPKPRNIGKGRAQGYSPGRRERYSVANKAGSRRKKARAPA
jgi:hypothetical protein